MDANTSAPPPQYQQPQTQMAQYGAPEGQPQQPQYAPQPQYAGQPQYAPQPQYGQPQYAGQPQQYGQPQYAPQPMAGQPQYAPQPQQFQPQPQTVVLQPGQTPAVGVPFQLFNVAAVIHVPAAKAILTDGLFGCCDDCEACLMAAFFSPCAFGSWVEMAGLDTCCSSCCIYIYSPCRMVYAGTMRQRLFKQLGVEDPGCCSACCVHSFCSTCAISQEIRAVKTWHAFKTGATAGPVVIATTADPNAKPADPQVARA